MGLGAGQQAADYNQGDTTPRLDSRQAPFPMKYQFPTHLPPGKDRLPAKRRKTDSERQLLLIGLQLQEV